MQTLRNGIAVLSVTAAVMAAFILGAAAQSVVAFGVPFVAPPDIPADRLAALRNSFVAMMKDPEFIAESESQNRDTTFHHPDQMLKLANQLKSISPEKLKQLETILPGAFN